jgi:DNA-binding MarR family transcriptional regulator
LRRLLCSATSADLATEFDVDRGAASYHLRQLARFGFVEETISPAVRHAPPLQAHEKPNGIGT